jgi:glycosyltransferase involved in cell wall biosynthesis
MSDQTGQKKILWHSGAPWAPTGYGQQTALFAPRLQALGYELALSTTWGLDGDTLEWAGMPVYPRDEQYGNRTLAPLTHLLKPDLVIALLDAWVLSPELMQAIPNLAVWTPVDHDPCPPRVWMTLRQGGARVIAMSRFGEKALQAEGIDSVYVPHGVDTKTFRPASNKVEIREVFGVPESAFVVGMVANNQGHTPPRKAFPQAVQAFAAFRAKHPDALLYLHTELTGKRSSGPYEGLNLPQLCDRFDIPESAVRSTDQLRLELGVSAEQMCGIYNTFDVLLNPSYGEGFGVPIIEAQACGVPVIVNNWTSMPELAGSGWVVDGEPWWDSLQQSFFKSPFVGDIFEALCQAYDNTEREKFAQVARAFAEQYDADRVTEEFWRPALEQLLLPQEVQPLRPNRAMRRAAARKKVA